MSDEAPATTPPPAPSMDELQAEVAAARDELVTSLSELKTQTAPKALVQRGGRSITGWFTDEYGGIRPERVAIAGAVVVGLIAIRIVARRRR